MSIFSSIKNVVSTVTTKLSDTFLPSSSVAAERRDKVFGTENKAIATTAIVGTGVAAIIAGPAAIVGGVAKVGQKVATSFTSAKVTTQAAIVGGGLVAAGAIAENPAIAKSISETPKNLVNFGSNIGKVTKSPSKDTFNALITENPLLTAGTIAAAGLVVGKTVSGVVGNITNTIATNENTAALKALLNEKQVVTPVVADMEVLEPDSKLEKAVIPAADVPTQPYTPATQVIGKSVATKRSSSKRKTAKKSNFSQNIRINLYNQSKVLNTRACY